MPTIIEVINKTDAFKFNTFSPENKIEWLSKLDAMIKNNIIDTHEGGESVAFSGYTLETPLDTLLIVGPPHDGIYQKWLEAQIDLANGEYERYNASITLFADEYDTFVKQYNKSHRHISRGKRFRF